MPELLLHGIPTLRLDDGRSLPLSAREAALLAWLHLEGPTPRAAIAGRLWPGGGDAKARANLRQTLARLRRAAGAVVDESDGGLRLAAAVAPGGDARLLGPIELDDAPEIAEWLAARREAERRDALRRGLATARERLDAGDLDAALAAADALLAADPAIEEAHRVRMEVFYRRDDRAAAVGAWDACRDALRAAFGIAPSAATNELGRLILARDAAPGPPRSRALPAALRRPPRLVGRDAVLAELRRALALGHGVVVAGAGGIGKSRLVAELAAGDEAAVAVGARPGDALLPGTLVQRLLDAAARFDARCAALEAPELRSALDRRQWFAAVAAALAGARSRGLGLVVVDDLQFADTLSAEALQVAFGVLLADDAARLVVAARVDELPAAGQALLAMLTASGRALRLDLAPLAVDEVRALLDGLPLPPEADRDALAAALVAQVGGNPAYLLEVLKSLWLDGFDGAAAGAPLPLPATLLDAVRSRLERLPDNARQVAQLAAVAGADFSPALAAAALGRMPLALAPVLAALEAAQVFTGPRFCHDLVAEAVQRSLPAALAPPLHRIVAEHLAAHGGAPAAVARHWSAAGDERAAAPWQLKAADAARRAWQMADAAARFEAAARALPDDDEAGRREAWLGVARCALWARRHEEAEAALARAEPLTHDAADAARLLALQCSLHFNARRIGAAVRAAGALLDALPPVAAAIDATALADAQRIVTSCVPYGVDAARALALGETLRPLIDAAGDRAAQLAFRGALGGLRHWHGEPLAAAAELGAAWARARPDHDAGARVLIANQRLRVQHALGELDAALASGVALLAEAEPLEPGVVFVTDVMHVVAMVEVAAGRAAAGIARFDALLARLAAAGEPVPDLFLTSLALACVAVGRHDEAAAWLDRHPAPGRDGLGLQDLGLNLTRARLATVRGEDATPWLALAARATGLPPGLELQRSAALASMRPPPWPAAAALAAELGRRGMRGLERVAVLAAAKAALAAGERDAALAQVQRALALEAVVDGWVDEPASVWHGAAAVLAGCGRGDEARAVAARGAEWVRAGAGQWSDAAARRAWTEVHPLHRALLAGTAAAPP